ncbi:MAG: hypothetical protein LBC92_03540 [Rickettsiales bacterium]|jgi:alpha/beta superfamily hydrolase|nr:hypothetical protein [Rickettsiales bacterium]
MDRNVVIKGPDCKLKALYYKSKNLKAPVAVILHPELPDDMESLPPLVESVINLLVEKGFSVLFYNFKRHNNIIGNAVEKKCLEIDEVVHVLHWVEEKSSYRNSLWLMSFDSCVWTCLQIVMRRPEVTDYVLFSPTKKLKELNFIVPCTSKGLVIYETSRPNSVNDIIDKINKNSSAISSIPMNFVDLNKNEHKKIVIEELERYIEESFDNIKAPKVGVKRERRRRKRKKQIVENVENIVIDDKVAAIKPLDLDF